MSTPFRSIIVSAGLLLFLGAGPSLLLGQESANSTEKKELTPAEKPLCGAYCLYVGLVALDVDIENLETLQKKLGPPPKAGYSMARLAKTAESYGVKTLAVQTDLERLAARKQRFACIAHYRRNHFVNITDIDDVHVHYCDPPLDGKMPHVTFNSQWDGKALLLALEPLVPEEDIVLPSEGSWGSWTAILAGAVMLAVIGVVVYQRRNH